MAKQIKNKEDILTPFQQQFIDIWFNLSFNGRLAYKQLRPNVSNTSADEMASAIIAQEKVKNYIELKREQIRLKEEIKLDWVVSELKNIVLDVKGEQIERDPQTNRILSRPQTKDAIAALALLSKIAGFETKKLDVTTNGKDIFNEITVNIIKPKE